MYSQKVCPMRSVFTLLVFSVALSSCQTNKPALNLVLEMDGKPLPQLSNEQKYKKYLDAPDGKILAVSQTNNGFYYRYGHCNLTHAISLTLRNCANRTRSVCKIIAIGNNDVRKMNGQLKSRVASEYQSRIADEHAHFAKPSLIQNLSALTAASEANGSSDGIYIGKISADRATPCAGHFQINLTNLGTCSGVWKNVDVNEDGGIPLTLLRITANCENDARLTGVAAMHKTEFGLAELHSNRGGLYRTLIGNAGNGIKTAKDLRAYWEQLLSRPDLEPALEFLKGFPKKSGPV